MRTYPADSEIPITDVGESTRDALVCKTDKTDCCDNTSPTRSRQGDWSRSYPNGNLVRNSFSGDDIYRTRGASVVLLKRRNDATGPTGQYCCEVATFADPDARICINLSKMN